MDSFSGKKEEKEEERKKQQKVPLLKLFAFADLYDYVLMGLGSLGACVHGASVPVFFIFFGKLINIIGLAYLFPKQASHRVAKVYTKQTIISILLLILLINPHSGLQYSLDFVYLSIVILFSSWTGKIENFHFLINNLKKKI